MTLGKKPTLHALDIGYGNTKYAVGRSGGEIRCELFPSVAPLASNRDIGGGITQKRDIVRVTVGDADYLVGPDSTLSLKGDFTGRVLNREYPETDRYLALARGALRYIGSDEIDLLVTGLPVDYYGGYRHRLESRLSGEHQYPDGKAIHVKKAWVVPQPLGGFAHHAIESNAYDALRESNSLILDVGFFTVDWLVCRGLKVSEERSGSVPGGMSKVLTLIAQEISSHTGEPFSDINRVDLAVRKGGRLEWYGKPLDIKPFYSKTAPIMDEATDSILSSVGTLDDIGSVILVGGGASFYLESLRRICKRNPLVMVNNGIFANVRGFYQLGEKRGG